MATGSSSSDRPPPQPSHLWGREPRKRPGTLILVRHGQSTWNLENLFTGWHDVPLSERGVAEAIEAGRLIKKEGLFPGVLHTSVLVRAIETANLALGELGLSWIPVRRSWRLNERHYGALQGLNKAETSAKYGADKVKVWRRSYDVAPPALEPSDERHPAYDRRYRDLPPELIPSAECLKDVLDRMLPYWYDAIVPDLLRYSCVLVSAHGNSLRALVKHLDGLTDQQVIDLDIPTGVPRVYELDAEFKPVSWRYLGDAKEIEQRAAAVRAQAGSSEHGSS
jgi:2,3-bisphosphoglycerate-dependent phosphoglycerate mutase